MAAITIVTPDVNGETASGTAATAGPDTLAAGSSDVILFVDNANAGTVVVTVTVPGNTEFGVAAPDVPSQNILTGTKAVIRIPARLADPADSLIRVTAAPNSSVTFYAFRAN